MRAGAWRGEAAGVAWDLQRGGQGLTREAEAARPAWERLGGVLESSRDKSGARGRSGGGRRGRLQQ